MFDCQRPDDETSVRYDCIIRDRNKIGDFIEPTCADLTSSKNNVMGVTRSGIPYDTMGIIGDMHGLRLSYRQPTS